MPGPNPRLLLVEGRDDKHVVQHVLRAHDGPIDFDIRDAGGIKNVQDAIPVELQVEGRVALGILVDANDDLARRWQSLGDTLRKTGYTTPTAPEVTGTILEGPEAHSPRVGVWLMPDNDSAGELEDFVRRLVPQDDPVWQRAEAYVDGIPADDRRFPKGKETRAKLHAWLAVREEPRLMGSAIGVGDLDASAPSVRALIAWLRRVFETGAPDSP